MGEPRATRKVRMITADGQCQQETKDDKDGVDLPPHYSKFCCCMSFVVGLGCKLAHDPKGRVTNIICLVAGCIASQGRTDLIVAKLSLTLEKQFPCFENPESG